MTDLLFYVLLPTCLCGAFFYGLLWLLRPLFARLRPLWQRRALQCAALLLALPLPIYACIGLAMQHSFAVPTAQSIAHTPVAPFYQAGQALGNWLRPTPAKAAPAGNTSSAPGSTSQNSALSAPSAAGTGAPPINTSTPVAGTDTPTAEIAFTSGTLPTTAASPNPPEFVPAQAVPPTAPSVSPTSTHQTASIAPPTTAQLLHTVSLFYLAGVCVFLLLGGLRYLLLWRRLRRAIILAHTVPESTAHTACYAALCRELAIRHPPRLLLTQVYTPILIGPLRPRILLPALAASPEEIHYALHHELTHYQQRDLLWKLLLFLLSALHWYNPLVHLLRLDFARICEAACDERSAQNLSFGQRKAYAAAMLYYAAARPRFLLGGTVAFVHPVGQLKRRIGRLLHPARPSRTLRATAAGLLALCLCAALLAGCSLAAGTANSSSLDETIVSGSIGSGLPADSAGTSDSKPDSNFPPLPDFSEPLSPSIIKFPLWLPFQSETDEVNVDHAFYHLDSEADSTTIDILFLLEDPPGFTAYGTLPQTGRNPVRLVVMDEQPNIEIYASRPGLVLETVSGGTDGGYLVLQHPDNTKTIYSHCNSNFHVQPGDAVDASSLLATSKGTHYAIWQLNAADTMDRLTAQQAETLIARPAEADSQMLLLPILDLDHILLDGHTTHQGIDLIGRKDDMIDLASYTSVQVYAAAAGTVDAADWDDEYGYHIWLRHNDGSKTLYAHLSTLLVAKGDTVRRGQPIGTQGNTGNSTGPHLHFELHLPNGSTPNPLGYLPVPEDIYIHIPD